MSRPRKHPQHRPLSPEEMEAMGFADMASHDAEDGWPYPDEMQRKKRYQYEILPVCQAIHSSECGASDPLDKHTLSEYVDFLRLRLDTWYSGHASSNGFDNAVRGLMCATLAEVADRRSLSARPTTVDPLSDDAVYGVVREAVVGEPERELPAPDLATIERARQEAIEGKGCTIDEILAELRDRPPMTDAERKAQGESWVRGQTAEEERKTVCETQQEEHGNV